MECEECEFGEEINGRFYCYAPEEVRRRCQEDMEEEYWPVEEPQD